MRWFLFIFLVWAHVSVAADPPDPPPGDKPPPEHSATFTPDDLGPPPQIDEKKADDTSRFFEITLRDGTVYRFSADPPNPQLQAVFDGLNPDEKARFLEARAEYLGRSARLFHFFRRPIGAKAALKAGIWNFVRRLAGYPPVEGPQGVKARGEAGVHAMLQALDMRLWMEAPLLIQRNEFNLTFLVSAGGALGVGKWVLGANTTFLFSLNYTRGEKAVSLEIYQLLDVPRRAIPFAASAGLTIGVVAGSGRYDWSKPSYFERAEMFEGPGFVVGILTPSTLRVGGGVSVSPALPYLAGAGPEAAAANFIIEYMTIVDAKGIGIRWARLGLSPQWPYLRFRSPIAAVITAPVKWAFNACKKVLANIPPPPPHNEVDARWYGF